MTYSAKQIYRKLTDLFPNLHTIQPFNRIDLKDQGFPNMELTVLESDPDKINFILSRYETERGHLIANPSIEILVDPKKKTAHVATYKDRDYFHSAVPKPVEIGTIARSQANRFLYDWLNNLKNWNRSLSEKNFLKRPGATYEGR
jgi:uncharacterized protein YqiB (DUF1249 family)